MKLEVSLSKTLKLLNVLIQNVIPSELPNVSMFIQQQENYLKSHGCVPVGPIIQYGKPFLNNRTQVEYEFKSLRQSDKYLNHVTAPYTMKSILRIPDCMYVRYVGPESKMYFAYDKINVTAFEEDIELIGDSYTIYINQVDDIVTADVFMEKMHDIQ